MSDRGSGGGKERAGDGRSGARNPRPVERAKQRGTGRGAAGSRRTAGGQSRGDPHARSRGGEPRRAQAGRGVQPTRSARPGRPAQPRRAIGEAGTRSVRDEIRHTARSGQAERALRAFDQAVSLLERGRDAAAIGAALEAKDIAGRSGAIREVLGLALYGAGRYRDALRELQAYRRLTGRVDQNHLIADSLRALGHGDKAVEPVREALRARVPPEVRAEAAVVGAAALADLGRYPEALAMLKGFPTDPKRARDFDLRVWYATGDVLARAGRPREAAEEFRRVMRHDPAAFDAAERLAQLG